MDEDRERDANWDFKKNKGVANRKGTQATSEALGVGL